MTKLINQNRLSIISLATISALLSGCGSSSKSEEPVQNTLTLPSLLVGEVSAISSNSITVNQHQIATNNADIEVDDNHALISDLKVGMMVEVETNGKEATQIDYDPSFKGPVSINEQGATIAGFKLNNLNTENLSNGSLVELSGYNNSHSEFTVTYQQPLSNSAELELEGFITDLNTASYTFKLGDLTVQYQQADIDGALENNQFVEVEGRLEGNLLMAQEVDAEHNFTADDDLDTALFGTITFINNDASLVTLNNQWQVSITNQTKFEDTTRATLTIGDTIEVDAIWQQANNWFLAHEIDLEKSHTSPNLSSNFSVSGFANYSNGNIIINGISLKITNRTVFEDGLTADTLSGEWLELEGLIDGQSYIVSEIERDNSNEPLELKGIVTVTESQQASLFGYISEDNSLASFTEQYVDLECQWVQDNIVRACRLDD